MTWSKAKLDPVSLRKFHFDKDRCHGPWKSTWNGCPCYRPLAHPKEKQTPSFQCPCSTTVDGSEILRSPVEVGSLSHFLAGFLHHPLRGSPDLFHKKQYVPPIQLWAPSPNTSDIAVDGLALRVAAPRQHVANRAQNVHPWRWWFHHAGTDIQSNIQPRGMED